MRFFSACMNSIWWILFRSSYSTHITFKTDAVRSRATSKQRRRERERENEGKRDGRTHAVDVFLFFFSSNIKQIHVTYGSLLKSSVCVCGLCRQSAWYRMNEKDLMKKKEATNKRRKNSSTNNHDHYWTVVRLFIILSPPKEWLIMIIYMMKILHCNLAPSEGCTLKKNSTSIRNVSNGFFLQIGHLIEWEMCCWIPLDWLITQTARIRDA